VDEAASSDERPLVELNSEEDQHRDRAERLVRRMRRMSTHARSFPVLVSAIRDSGFGFVGTVVASGLRKFMHDEPQVVIDWIEGLRRGDAACGRSFASIRGQLRASERALCVAVAEHLESRATPALLLVAGLTANALRAAQDGWQAKNPPNGPEPDPGRSVALRLESAIRVHLSDTDIALRQAALGSLIRAQGRRGVRALPEIVRALVGTQRRSVTRTSDARRRQRDPWRAAHRDRTAYRRGR